MASGVLRRLDLAVRPVETTAAVVGGVMMVMAMTLMTLDAVMRYLFTSPIQIAPASSSFI